MALVHLDSGYVVTESQAQNYFPATATAALVDSDSSAGISVSFSSSHGVASLVDGSLEVMLHRRMVDIGCRVDQGCAPLQDTLDRVENALVHSLRVRSQLYNVRTVRHKRIGVLDQV